jgi:LacI family transcriptional regulator
MSDRRIDLAAIAAQAGVSASTVSKVIHGREGVASATRDRVRRLLAETGYVSPMQRRARESGPTMVDHVIGGVSAGYTMEVLQGILSAAQSIDVDVVVSSASPGDLHQIDADAWATRMNDSGRTGLILVTSQLTTTQRAAFRQRGLPVVVIDPLGPPTVDLSSVGSTNWAGGKAATEHLIALGHRRIAYIGGRTEAECNVARLHGHLAALMAAGIAARPEYTYDGGSFGRAAGVAGATALLELEEPPTAVFAASDSIALGVLEVARAKGLDIPHDLSVVGFDGLPLAEQTLPPLTTVAQPLRDMGRAALRSVLRLAAGERLDSPRIELATELVVRGSTAPPTR